MLACNRLAATLAAAVTILLTGASISMAADKPQDHPGTSSSPVGPGGGADVGQQPSVSIALPKGGLIEDSDPAWVWSGMEEYDLADLHGGTGRAGRQGTGGAYTFRGTAVDVVGVNGPAVLIGGKRQPMGKIQVLIDDKPVGLATLAAPDYAYGAVLAHVTHLPEGNHVLQVKAVEGWIVVDYLKVTNEPTATGGGYSGTAIIPEGNYVIIPKCAPSRCLEATDASNQAKIDIFSLAPGHLQTWHVRPIGRDTIVLGPAQLPDLALSLVAVHTNEPGIPSFRTVGILGLYKYLGNPAQQWVVHPMPNGYFMISQANDVTAVWDVRRGNDVDGTEMISYYYGSGNNQQFKFRPIP